MLVPKVIMLVPKVPNAGPQGHPENTRETDNEARTSKEAEMKRKFNRSQKRITSSDIQLSSLIFLDKLT